MNRHAEIERVARDSYGRLLARLAVRTRDLAAAEDALADAFAAALERWPVDGVPAQPEGWLLTTARHRTTDRARHRAVEARAAEAIRLALEERAQESDVTVPDERLALLFVCAHPAIDPAVRTPLMLQVGRRSSGSRCAPRARARSRCSPC